MRPIIDNIRNALARAEGALESAETAQQTRFPEIAKGHISFALMQLGHLEAAYTVEPEARAVGRIRDALESNPNTGSSRFLEGLVLALFNGRWAYMHRPNSILRLDPDLREAAVGLFHRYAVSGEGDREIFQLGQDLADQWSRAWDEEAQLQETLTWLDQAPDAGLFADEINDMKRRARSRRDSLEAEGCGD